MIGIPPGPRRLAFRTFVGVLLNAPTFANRRVIRTWRVWDGREPAAPPTVAEMPAAMVRLLGGPIERVATLASPVAGGMESVDVQARPTVVIETWVKGTNADDAIDLYDAIDAALFPADDLQRAAIRAQLLAVGITDWQPVRDVLPESLSDYDSTSIHSVGAYLLTLDLTQ